METAQVMMFILVVQTLIIIALLLVIYGQGRQLGNAWPTDVKNVLGALAGLAMIYAAKTPTTVDDAVVTNVLAPIFKLLGIDIPTIIGGSTPTTTPTTPNIQLTINPAPTATPAPTPPAVPPAPVPPTEPPAAPGP